MSYKQPGPVVPHKHEWVIVGMDFSRDTGEVVMLRHLCSCGKKSEWLVRGHMRVHMAGTP